MNSLTSQGVTELLRACAESNGAEAWEQFIARYHRAISLAVLRTARRWGGIAQEIAADLVQETYLKLCDGKCDLLYRFSLSHPGAVEGYIRTIAANVTHDYFKSRQSTKHGSGIVFQPQEESDPVAQSNNFGGVAAIEQEVVFREIELCLNNCTEGPTQERDRIVFWLYYQQGLSAKAIAALPTIGLTVKGVESVIFKLTRLIRDQMQHRQAESSLGNPGNAKGFRIAKSY